MVDPSLLRVDRLTIRAGTGALARTIVDSISFEVGAERVALVGESGSGKSLTARALVGLLRPPLGMQAAGLSLGGVDLRRCGDRQWTRVRGAAVALMLQDPRFSLNPVFDVGRQLDAELRLHARLPDAERRERIELRAAELLRHPHAEQAGIVDREVFAEAGRHGFLGMAVPEAFVLGHRCAFFEGKPCRRPNIQRFSRPVRFSSTDAN